MNFFVALFQNRCSKTQSNDVDNNNNVIKNSLILLVLVVLMNSWPIDDDNAIVARPAGDYYC